MIYGRIHLKIHCARCNHVVNQLIAGRVLDTDCMGPDTEGLIQDNVYIASSGGDHWILCRKCRIEYEERIALATSNILGEKRCQLESRESPKQNKADMPGSTPTIYSENPSPGLGPNVIDALGKRRS